MDDPTYSKAQMLALTGMAENNLSYVTKLGYIAPNGPIRRGQRPRYSTDEILKAAIMEKSRALRVSYETSSAFVDRLREQSEQEERARRARNQRFVMGFWNVLKEKLDDQHIVWILIKDDAPQTMFLWRRPNPTPTLDEFARMAAMEYGPADGFDHYVILNVGPLIREIVAAAGSPA